MSNNFKKSQQSFPFVQLISQCSQAPEIDKDIYLLHVSSPTWSDAQRMKQCYQHFSIDIFNDFCFVSIFNFTSMPKTFSKTTTSYKGHNRWFWLHSSSTTVGQFQSKLKTTLFRLAYGIWLGTFVTV